MSADETLTKARKDHKCTLCGGRITRGSGYVYQRVTPWDHPDNECFFDYKAHTSCNQVWANDVGPEWDYEFNQGDYGDFREAMRFARDKGQIPIEEGVCFGRERSEED